MDLNIRIDVYHHTDLASETIAKVEAILDKLFLFLDQITRDPEKDRQEMIALTESSKAKTADLAGAIPITS